MSETFQHEANHSTDKEFIQNLRNKREGKDSKEMDAHQNINPQEKKAYEEMQNSNEKR